MASQLTARRTTRANSKQPESNLPEHVATIAENIVEKPPTETSLSGDTRQSRESPFRAMSSRAIAKRATGATSKQREHTLPALIAPPIKDAADIKPQDPSRPKNHAQPTNPRPTVPFRSRPQRTMRRSSKQRDNTISALKVAEVKDDSDKRSAAPSAATQSSAGTAATFFPQMPKHTSARARRPNSKQPELKVPLPTISELENTSETQSAQQAAPALPPRHPTKRTTRGNSKQPWHMPPRTSTVDDAISREDLPPSPSIPVPPPRVNKKPNTGGNSKEPGHTTIGPMTSDVERSATPTVSPPTTATAARASSATKTSTTLTTAPCHPDPYFNQPLSLIIQRTKPPPHATASALAGSAFSCSMCPSIVHGAANSIRHLRTHDGVEVQCRLCDKQFRTSDSLKGHWIRHHPEKPRVWIIAELKSFYKDWSKSGVQKWCGEWKGVVGGEVTAKGKTTSAESKPTNRKPASDNASSADLSVAFHDVQQTASGKTGAVSIGTKGSVTLEVSEQVVESPESTDEVLMTTARKGKDVVEKNTPNVAEHRETAMRGTTGVWNKKRKTAEDAKTDDINSKKHKPTAAQDRGIGKPPLPIPAQKRTNETVRSKTKSTTTNWPSVQQVKKVFLEDKPKDEPGTESADPATTSNKSVAQEKDTTTEKVPGKTTAKEIPALRTLRKRKAAIENKTDPADIKKHKVVKDDAVADRLLMPPPVVPRIAQQITPVINNDDGVDPEMERRRLLCQALGRFQVHIVPPKLLDTNTAGEMGNKNHQVAPEAGIRGNNEAAELSQETEDDLYSYPLLHRRITVRRAGNCGNQDAVANAMFKQVVDSHVEAYTKRLSA